MELHVSHFVTFGLLFVLILLIFLSYSSIRKKCSGFPFSHIIPHVIYCYISGKISKDTPLNYVLFQKLIQVGKQHMKEGLFMTFIYRPTLFIFNEEAIKVFANERAAADKSPDYEVLEGLAGAGLITSNGKRWRKHRKMINPVFQMGNLKEKVSLFNDHAMALVQDMEKLAGKPSVNLLETLKCHYFYALSESVLGLKPNKENEAQILKLSEIAESLLALTVRRMFYPFLRPRFVLKCFPFVRQYYQLLKEVDNYITNVIFEMKEHVYSNRNMDTERFSIHLRKSLTYVLLDRHLKDPSFTIEDLHSEVKTMIGAGYDTVGYTTMWCLFLLGLHPDVQEKAFNEVLSTTGNSVTYEETSNLVYLEAVIMETMRLYSTIPIFGRSISEDIQFGEYKVLKGTTVFFFPYLLHRNPKIYPDPEKFEPERFLCGDSKTPNSFIPFSEGSRSCIGKNYALLEMKIFLSHVLRNFQITSLDKREDLDLCCKVVVSPLKPIRMKIMRRYDTSSNF